MEEEERTNEETRRKGSTNPPKGVSEKDYADFLKLLDRLNVSEEESLDEDMENGGEGETEKDETTNDVKREGEKKVQFAKGTVTHSTAVKKSILRNRNERSPINNEELQKICRRDFVEFRPTPKEILSDYILERTVGLNQKTKKTAEKRKSKKGKAMSAWKTRKMGIPSSDDEERI